VLKQVAEGVPILRSEFCRANTCRARPFQLPFSFELMTERPSLR
jgi:hypothetical protein